MRLAITSSNLGELADQNGNGSRHPGRTERNLLPSFQDPSPVYSSFRLLLPSPRPYYRNPTYQHPVITLTANLARIMGIDADAYMAGAIPSLNRGGSWRLDDGHGSQFQSLYGHGEGSGTGGSIFPRPSQIVPPLPPSTAAGVHANMNLNLGNRGNFHPLQSHAMSTIVYPPFMSPGSSMGSPSIRPDGGTAYVGSQSGGSRKAMSARPTLMLVGGRSQSGGSIGSRVQSVRSANHPGWASLRAGGGGGEASRVGGVESESANGRKIVPEFTHNSL